MAGAGVPASLVRRVRERAREYCGLRQEHQEATFHVDHVIHRRAGGPTVLQNPALACVSCSLRKGARQTAPDPARGTAVDLFNPRVDSWPEHFEVHGTGEVAGLTPTGRSTVAALHMNRPLAVAIRLEEARKSGGG